MTAEATGPALSVSAHRAGRAAAGDHDLSAFPDLARRLDLAVLRAVAAGVGAAAGPGPWTADEVADAFGAAERHRWIPGHWIAALADEGMVTAEGSAFRLAAPPRRRDLAAVRRDLDRARAGLGFPPALTAFLLRTLRELPRLLRDEVSAQSLLFPGGDTAVAEAVYRDNPFSRYLNAAAADTVRHLRAAGPDGLRVLELGAGIGATSADLLPALDGRTAEYRFTDLSPFFLDLARGRFPHPFLRFEVLDFATGLPETTGPFDLVVAANTAHNAPHVPRLLGQVADLLAPDGRLLLIETCREPHQSLTSMPFLLSGRAARQDLRAGTERTYLTRREWREALHGAGLRVLVDLPHPTEPLDALSQRLLLAAR
ncbi:bifunctional 2-polyprenyl-6-hydroxyphenol methylase/3-demethylubiquinol 3-O-methyltransferase UbiG [Nocardiopsis sp. NRRL B-16309]|uniref:class I SAM-dependent methyltransferase n=1 Tax=Nocardiopsis sp. NRRL B-16309 TaxID=1519494 RepID=UPI0006AE5CED|nr:class I SAM-dependent methyltransferase [Nocardiopsis sp. NRRL B-16309]